MFAESTNHHYNALKKKYDDYVKLYLFLNDGSTDGITPFADFYWRFTYLIKYEHPSLVGIGS